jgi:hypothetical protein
MKGAGNNHQQPLKQMDMTINIGTKGLVCNLWEVRERREGEQWTTSEVQQERG